SRSRNRAGTTRRPLSSRLCSAEPVKSGRSDIRTSTQAPTCSTSLHYTPPTPRPTTSKRRFLAVSRQAEHAAEHMFALHFCVVGWLHLECTCGTFMVHSGRGSPP